MRRLRLHVQVLPWQNSTLPNGSPQNTRPAVVLPWIEPCAEDISLQELSERIMSRFASIHPGKGVLNIECLQNYWGYILDMPLTVGEVFDDLPGSTDISRSIVKVVRCPPTPDELENPLRFVSLAPESSARPQKRRLTQLAGPTGHNQHGGENEQHWGSDNLIDDDGRASKRRKLQNPISHSMLGLDRPNFPSEGLQDGVYNSSQTSAGRLSPCRQVLDSPRSSLRKQDNSYGTPMSLSLNSPQIDPSKLHDPIAIPDSPPRRDGPSVDGNIRSTKSELHALRSESPELGSSNNRGSIRDSGIISAEQAPLKPQALQGHVEPPLITPGPLKDGPDGLRDQPTPREPNGAISGLRDMVGPIDRDSEKSHELRKLLDAKQAKSEHSASQIHNLEDREHGKRNGKAIAKMTKSTPMVAEKGGKQYLAFVNLNKKPAPRWTSPSDSKAAGETPNWTGDEVSVKEKPEGMHPVEGSAQQSQAKNENSNEIGFAVESERFRPAEEQRARDIEPIELATTMKRADEITKKTELSDKRDKNGKLAEEANIVRPTKRKASGATLAKGKAGEAASVETDAGTNMADTRIEAVKQVERNPQEISQEGSQTMRKTKLAMSAGGKKPVKAVKENQVRDMLDKKSIGRGEEGEDKTLGKSKESVPLRQMNPPKKEKLSVASDSVPILNSEDGSKHITENKSLENIRKQSEIFDERNNGSGSQNSTTPVGTRIRQDRMGKSMTPPYPSSLSSKSRLKSSAPSHGTSLPKSLISDTLPSSAIKQTSSLGRRSVSFAEDSTAPSDSRNSNRGISSEVKALKSEQAMAESQAPRNKSEESKAPTTKVAKKEKIQTKLKVQRDVKLKGRVIDPPVPPEATTREEIAISSDSNYSVSSFYSEDDLEIRNARPGPSKKRQSTARAEPGKNTKRIKVEPSSVPVKKLTKSEDTQPSTGAPKTNRREQKLRSTPLVNSTQENPSPGIKVQKLNKDPSSAPVQNVDPQILSFVSSSERSSSPRAPAQYMSRAVSISSLSTSDVSGSDSDDNNSPPLETKRKLVKEETRPDRIVPDKTAGVEMPHAHSVSLNGSQSSSRSSKALPLSSRSSRSTSGSDSQRIERAAEEQLQRESLSNSAKSPGYGLPPTNSDFPRMTDLIKKQTAVVTSGSGNQRSSYPLPSKPDASKRATLSPFSVSGSSSSGSLSDDEEDP